MDTRQVRLPLIPYLLAVLLIVFSILLDANVRSSASTSVEFSLSSTFGLMVDAKWAFGLLGGLFIWMVARLNLSTLSAWIYIIFGLIVSAFPMAGVAGLFNPNQGFAFLQGDYLLTSAAMILAAGLLMLFSRIGPRKPAPAPPPGK